MVCPGRAWREKTCRREQRKGKLKIYPHPLNSGHLSCWVALRGSTRPLVPWECPAWATDPAGAAWQWSLLTQPGSLQELWPQKEPIWFHTLAKSISAAKHESSVLLAEMLHDSCWREALSLMGKGANDCEKKRHQASRHSGEGHFPICCYQDRST